MRSHLWRSSSWNRQWLTFSRLHKCVVAEESSESPAGRLQSSQHVPSDRFLLAVSPREFAFTIAKTCLTFAYENSGSVHYSDL